MAQQKLRDSFGMELVELPSRTELEQENDPATHTQTQTQDGPLATGIKKRGLFVSTILKQGADFFYFHTATTGSKTYMVRSCLDPLIIEHAAQTLPKILEEEGGDQGTLFPSTLELDEEEEGEEDGDRPPKFYGSLISWSRADQLGSIGILYVILALVLANNRVMSDGKYHFNHHCLHTSTHFSRRPPPLSKVPPSHKQSSNTCGQVQRVFNRSRH